MDLPASAAPDAGFDFRPMPQSVADLKLPEIFLANLALKHCFYAEVFTLADLVERLKVPPTIVTQLLEYLKREKYVEVRGADVLQSVASPVALTHRHALNDTGKRRALQLQEYDAYVGPVPVALEDYWDQVGRQHIKLGGLNPARLKEVFEGLVISPKMLAQLGPAAVSGKPLFLYGPPGNGKTTVALRLSRVWEDAVLLPYAIYVAGSVIRVYDDFTHQAAARPDGDSLLEDRRWVRCRRPTVIVGGELTLDMLDLVFNPVLKYYEAPLQLKANSGIFLVDDFGRQTISPQELLNRWIIPLENRRDYLCLHTGQKFAIPFDMFLVFATNLEPRTLVDDAFLRRIRSKVKMERVSRDEFIQIFRLVASHYGLAFDLEAVEYLLQNYYDGDKKSMDACHPRDLTEQIIDYCTFNQVPPALTPENFDWACRNYFVY